MKFKISAGTRQGPNKPADEVTRRKSKTENEDRYVERSLGGGLYLLAVMDGVGSDLLGGAVAQWVKGQLESAEFYPTWLQPNGLVEFIRVLQCDFIEEWNNPKWLESGCTLTLAVVDDETEDGILAWMGDSPAFIVRADIDAGTEVLTVPHSDPNDALTSCFGSNQNVTIDVCEFVLKNGDVLALATDGVATSLDSDKIDKICRAQVGGVDLIPAGTLHDDATFVVARCC